MKCLWCLQFLGIFSATFKFSHADSTKFLTENFFANLEENLKGEPTNEATYSFINKQIDNYIKLIKSTRHSHNSKSRRRRDNLESIDVMKDKHDVFVVNRLTPLDIIKTEFPQDILLFKHLHSDCEKWYAVALEKRKEEILSIYKYNGSNFVKLFTEPVKGGIKLGVHTSENGTFIVAAENSQTEDDFDAKSTVYLFTRDEKLKMIQKFQVDFASDVSIWEDKGQIYMGISKEMSNTTGRAEYETYSVIYKWLGKHFDIIQEVKTSEARKIVPFVIGKSHFLAIPNRQNNLGASSVYSELLKYDLNQEKFVSYQKILTNGASDVKMFCFKKRNHHEYFLAVANTFSKDVYQNIDYKTKSIIYKFVDGYFIPFQSFDLIGLTEWLPVVGLDGEFALFAACKHEGLKIFQYNGWKFVKAETQFTDDSFGKGILSMNSYQFQGQPVVVVANSNDHGQMINMYEVSFNKQNDLNEYYDEMLTWCRKSLLDVKQSNEDELSRVIKSTPTVDEKEVVLSKRVTFKNLTVENLHTPEIENFERTSRLSDDPQLEDLKAALESEKQNLRQLEILLQNLTNPQFSVINHDIFAEEVIFENDSTFNKITSRTINEIDVKTFLDNIVYINGRRIAGMNLQNALFENNVTIGNINGRKANSLLYINKPMELGKVVIKGSAISEGIYVKGLINGVELTNETVLLVDGDQNFKADLEVETMRAQNSNAKYFNKLPLSTIGDFNHFNKLNTKKLEGHLDSLNIKQLIVGGYLNNVDLPTLNKHALRIKGDQTITGFYHFGGITAKDFSAKIANDHAIPEDFIAIDDGDFEINEDVDFSGGLNLDALLLSKRLNRIKVKKNKLDVLLKNSEDEQEIKGYKDFEDVDLVRPFDMQGKFNMKNNLIDPVKNIDEEVVLEGDVVIKGDIFVEDVLEVADLANKDKEFTITKLLEQGLRIDEEKVPVHLDFKQKLNVGNIVVDKINDVNISDWIVNGVEEVQNIKGSKIFEGDLFITGDTKLLYVNGINVPEMEASILKINGDQVVEGSIHVQKITAQSLQGNNVQFSERNWAEITGSDTKTEDAILKSLKAGTINCTNLNITGAINGINFNEMLEDTVFKNASTMISGPKHFTNLRIDNLTARKSISLSKIPTLIKKGVVEFNYNGVFEIPENLSVEHVYFGKRLNHLSAEEFNANWLGGGEDQVIAGDQYFEELVLYGDNVIPGEVINGINLTELSLETVKIDEEHEFGDVKFEEDLLSSEAIILRGHIEGVDIDTVVSSSDDEIVIGDKIQFLDDVFVKGNVHAESLINGFNFSALCEFAEPNINENPKSLIIEGNACFLKGPIAKTLNGLQMEELLKNTWMTNKETTFNGNLYLNKVFFEDDLEVKGLLGDVKVDWLKKTYFSKTKNQTVPAKLEFSDGIAGKKSLRAPRAKVETVSQINLDEFVRTALLDDFDQVFEEALYADIVKFNDFQGSFTVNDLNLETDVMRYDVPNIITGKKTINSVRADVLKLDRNIKVQDVDLLSWLQNGVLRSGSQKIDGRVFFRGSTIFNSGINLLGLLNQNVFNPKNIMLKSTPQTITGNKTFVQVNNNPSQFQNIKLKGHLNGMEISEMMHNQAFKNKPNIFTSQVNFNTDLTARNVVFESLFHGVNVSQLINNLTNLNLNNYYTNYDELHRVAKNVRNSLSVQAHYLNYYKELQYFTDVEAVFPVQLSFYEDVLLATVKIINTTHVINFYRLDPETNQFIINTDLLEINHGFFITRIAPLEIDDETYLYVEHKLPKPLNNNGRIGEIISILNKTSVEILHTIPNNGTKDIIPFNLPLSDKVCVLMSYHYELYIHIYCTEEHEGLQLYQKLEIPNAYVTTLATIDESVYIMAINKNHREDETAIFVWKSDKITGLFNIQQHIHLPNANDIVVTEYKEAFYLAISSGQIDNTMHTGQISIKRFHSSVQGFTEFQEIPIDAPISVEFALLPSNELMLYALCESATKPLIIYKFEGLSKFVQKSVTSSLEQCQSITAFNNHNKSYVITKSEKRATIIEAIFKGY